MHSISVEIYSENVASDIFYKPGLTQAWNIVHHTNTNVLSIIVTLTFPAMQSMLVTTMETISKSR